jgi:hypothetical protein
MSKIFFSFIAMASILFLVPMTTLAATTSGYESGLSGAVKGVETIGAETGTQGNLPVLVGNIINALLGVLGIVLVGILIYAGVLYLTAKGEPEKTKTAIKLITQAVIGIVSNLAAFAIANFVISALTTAAV